MDNMQKILYDTYSSAIEQIPEMIKRKYSLQIMDDIFDDGKMVIVGKYVLEEWREIDDMKTYLYNYIDGCIRDLSICNIKIVCGIEWIFTHPILMNDHILDLFRDDTIVYILIFFENKLIAEYTTSTTHTNRISRPYIINDKLGKSIYIRKRYNIDFAKTDKLHVMRTIESLSLGG